MYWSLIASNPILQTKMITRKIGDAFVSFCRPVVMEDFYSDDYAHAAVDLFNEVIPTFLRIANKI